MKLDRMSHGHATWVVRKSETNWSDSQTTGRLGGKEAETERPGYIAAESQVSVRNSMESALEGTWFAAVQYTVILEGVAVHWDFVRCRVKRIGNGIGYSDGDW